MSERGACRLMNQPRGTQRYQLTQREDEDALTRAIVEFASQYGRYGYRRITALLKQDGWQVGKDRVERIWRREGLKVPQRQSAPRSPLPCMPVAMSCRSQLPPQPAAAGSRSALLYASFPSP